MIGHVIAATLPRLRAEAQSRMTSTCTVSRPGEISDQITGEADSSPVWSGPCRVKTLSSRAESAADVSTSTVTVITDEVHVPVSAGPFLVGDIIDIASSPSNPAMAGARFRIKSLHVGDDTTAQRLPVERLA